MIVGSFSKNLIMVLCAPMHLGYVYASVCKQICHDLAFRPCFCEGQRA